MKILKNAFRNVLFLVEILDSICIEDESILLVTKILCSVLIEESQKPDTSYLPDGFFEK
jgi:hypothetical protein